MYEDFKGSKEEQDKINKRWHEKCDSGMHQRILDLVSEYKETPRESLVHVLFNVCDEDKDGVLDSKEFRDFAKYLGDYREQDNAKVWKRLWKAAHGQDVVWAKLYKELCHFGSTPEGIKGPFFEHLVDDEIVIDDTHLAAIFILKTEKIRPDSEEEFDSLPSRVTTTSSEEDIVSMQIPSDKGTRPQQGLPDLGRIHQGLEHVMTSTSIPGKEYQQSNQPDTLEQGIQGELLKAEETGDRRVRCQKGALLIAETRSKEVYHISECEDVKKSNKVLEATPCGKCDPSYRDEKGEAQMLFVTKGRGQQSVYHNENCDTKGKCAGPCDVCVQDGSKIRPITPSREIVEKAEANQTDKTRRMTPSSLTVEKAASEATAQPHPLGERRPAPGAAVDGLATAPLRVPRDANGEGIGRSANSIFGGHIRMLSFLAAVFYTRGAGDHLRPGEGGLDDTDSVVHFPGAQTVHHEEEGILPNQAENQIHDAASGVSPPPWSRAMCVGVGGSVRPPATPANAMPHEHRVADTAEGVGTTSTAEGASSSTDGRTAPSFISTALLSRREPENEPLASQNRTSASEGHQQAEDRDGQRHVRTRQGPYDRQVIEHQQAEIRARDEHIGLLRHMLGLQDSQGEISSSGNSARGIVHRDNEETPGLFNTERMPQTASHADIEERVRRRAAGQAERAGAQLQRRWISIAQGAMLAIRSTEVFQGLLAAQARRAAFETERITAAREGRDERDPEPDDDEEVSLVQNPVGKKDYPQERDLNPSRRRISSIDILEEKGPATIPGDLPELVRSM